MNAAESFALLRGNEILLAGADGQIAATLSSDSRTKSALRWLPDGERLSYLVEDPSGAKARLVVVDLAGKIAKEIPIRPVTDPPTEGLRFIEALSWVTASKARVSGSINPNNCEMFDLDIETKQESNWQIGECGSFSPSPDGKHIAFIEETSGSDDERRDTLEIDGDNTIYSDAGRMRILAGPVWSADSRQAAVLEKRVDSGELEVTILSVGGRTDSVSVPQYLSDKPSLAFVDSRVVIRWPEGDLLADPRRRTFGPVPEDVRAKLAQTDQARARADEAAKTLQSLIRRLGAGQGAAAAGVTKN